MATTTTPISVPRTRSRFRAATAAAVVRAAFAGGLPADRDRERLLDDLRALPDAPADVESCLRG